MHPTAGTYGAPGEVGAMDQVVLTDVQCTGEARADVLVVDGLALVPGSAVVLPGTAFQLEVHGGIGDATCALVVDGSGGTVDADCNYVAGAIEATDVIEAIDDAGYVAEAAVTVDAGAQLHPEGYAHWVIPLGASFVPASAGGSGVLDPVVTSGSATVLGGAVEGTVVGRSTVEVTDRFAGFQYTVTVDVVPPLTPDADWVGARNADTRALGPGDLDGDGYDDIIFASQELNSGAWEAGAVLVYAGGASGVAAVPVQSFEGSQRDQALGSSVFVSDVDGDGEKDLIIGVPRDDFTSNDLGSVRIHRGVSGGFFEDEPEWTLYGVNGSDRAGSSVGACDLDGDGFLDVIVGADGAEDRSIVDYPTSSGALLVYRGGVSGFLETPTTARYGQRLSPSGGFELWGSLELGRRDLAVGDVNGDGLCDVLSSVADDPWDASIGGTGEGFAMVWHGVAGDLLTQEPVRVYANLSDSSADFGRRLALADFDGDGLDDVVIGSHSWSGVASSNSGGVFVFLSTRDDGRDPAQAFSATEADWFAESRGGDNLGRGLSVGDVDGDGQVDLLAGAYTEDIGFSNSGEVRAWSGVEVGSAPKGDQWDMAFLIWDGDEDDARLGESLAAVGDVDGDGMLDVAAWAAEHDHYGVDVGRAFVWSNGSVFPLDLVGGAAGDQSGFSLAWADYDGDGIPDVVSGAPQTAVSTEGALTGAVDVFPADAGGFSATALPIDPGIDVVTSSDRYGEYLSGESDFDGDGYADLAIGARQAPTPSTWDPAWNNGDGCAEGWSNAGAVLVHRGGPTGISPVPSFAWFASSPVSNIEALRGGFDMNGDGYDDLVVADEDWSSGGGFSVVFGRPATSQVEILCADPIVLGVESGARLGHALAPIGDIDGDGCDEIAVAADDEDAGTDDRGVIHVIWGFGGPGCPVGLTKTALAPTLDDVEAGTSLDGGGDVDGDGIPDLVVGSVDLDVAGTQTGGVWLVSGSYLLSLPTQSWTQGGWVDPSSQVVHPLVEPGRDTLLEGPGPNVGFGSVVSLVPDPLSPGRSAVAVGAPLGGIGGVPLSGGVSVFRWSTGDDTWEPSAYAVVGGESHLEAGSLGSALRGGDDRGTASVLVGAFWSSAAGPDRGATYVAPLE